MITNLNLQAFKGITAEIKLSPLTVITGKNFVGKTSVIQAVTLLCNGSLPATGKSGKGVFQLASGPELRVSGIIDGEPVTRRWKQAGKTIRYEGPKGPVEGAVNPLSAEAFAAAAPAVRLNMLSEHAGKTLVDLDTLSGKIRVSRRIKLPEADSSLGSAELLKEALAELLKAARAEKVQFDKTIAGLVQLDSTDFSEEPEDLTNAISTAAAAAARAESALEQAASAVTDGHDARQALEEHLKDFPESKIPPVSPDNSELPELRSRVATGQQAVSDLKAVIRSLELIEVEEWTEADEEKLKALRELIQDRNWQQELNYHRQFEVEAKYKAKDLQGRIDTAAADIAKIQQSKCCPNCGSENDWASWQAKLIEMGQKTIRDTTVTRDAELDREKAESEFRIRAEERCGQASEAMAMQGRRDRSQNAAESVASLPQKRERLVEYENRLLARQKQVEACTTAAAEYSSKAQQHDRFKSLVATVKPAAELAAAADAARAAVAVTGEELDALRRRHAEQEPARIAWQQKLGRSREMEAARTAAAAAEVEQKALESTMDELSAEVEKQLKQLYTPVIETGEALSQGLLPSPLTLDPLTTQIGRWQGTTFIPFELMSGAEQLTAIAVLQTALATQGRGIVMLDELPRMRPEIRAIFAERIALLVESGQLSQAIFVDHSPEGYSADWHVIRMGE